MDQKKQERGGQRAMALITGVVLISGCSSASSVTERHETTGSISAMSHAPLKTTSTPKVECPGLDIRPGASTLNIAIKTAGATGSDLRYQLSVGQTARECRVQDGRMSVKVGVQGRILLGPMGSPGSIDIPLRYAVVREGPEPRLIVTKLKRIGATIPAGQTHIKFVDIEDGLNFALPSTSELEAYVVYVGFDELGDKDNKSPLKPSVRAN
jgi:hypothetical protein